MLSYTPKTTRSLRCYAIGTTSGTRWERGYCSSDFYCRNLQRGEALRAVWVTRCSSVNRSRWVIAFERGESLWCIQCRLILTADILLLLYIMFIILYYIILYYIILYYIILYY